MNEDYRDGRYEWNKAKNRANVIKHSLSFDVAVRIFEGMVFEALSKGEHGEERIFAIGALETNEIVVIYTDRRNRKRIISARRAKKYEREIYKKFVQRFHV